MKLKAGVDNIFRLAKLKAGVDNIFRLALLLVTLLSAADAMAQEPGGGHAGLSCPGSTMQELYPEKDVVKLLLMLPLSSEGSHNDSAPWDRGSEILPAACLAVQQVNSHPHLLQDSVLELQVVDIQSCIVDEFTSNINALTPFLDISSDSRNDVLGIVGGPFCPPLLTRLVSPLASKNKLRLFQMFASTAESVRSDNQIMHFITPSIKLYYETVYAAMRVFDWSKLYVIAESFFKDLRSVRGSEGLDITFRQFDSSSSLIPDLRLSEKNIVSVSLSPQHAADVLCQAHDGSLLYPDYVWIFHDLTPDAILDSNGGECDRETLRGALSGTFFLRFPFSPDSLDTALVSGTSYLDYMSGVSELNGSTSNPFANILYDSVWAVSLTLNRSLDGEPFSRYSSREQREVLIELMDRALPEVSFQGASGRINFSASERVVNDAVDIYLYNDGAENRVGRYETSIQLSIADEVIANVPRDTLSSVNVVLPGSLVGVLAASVIVCVVLTTGVLALFIYYRNDSDIKATSPHLSYLMFLGCYLLLGATLVHTIRGAVSVTGVGTVLVCGAVVTGDSLGVNLIFATLLLRMLRVYRIFNHFGKTGKLWSNRNLVCIVGVILLGDVVVILVWSFVDTYRIINVVTLRVNTNPPHYERQQFCHSQHLSLWLGVLLGKLGVLFVIVLFLAVKTRKIRKSNFKDTKKVNMYIFSTVTIVIIFMTLFFLFIATENALAAHLMVYSAFGFTALLCQLFLFVPKVTSPLLKKYGYEVSYSQATRPGGRTRTVVRKQDKSRPLISLMTNTQFARGL